MKNLGRKITLAAILGSTVLAGCQENVIKSSKEVRKPISSKVELSQKVDYGSMETAIIRAARDFGYGIEIKDIYSTNYKFGSIKEMEEYSYTKIILRKNLFWRIEIDAYKNLYGTDYFWVDNAPLSFTSDNEIKKYLETVSKYLPK